MFLRSCANNNLKIIWFDIETTGFNIFQNSIIEIAAIDNKERKFQSLVSYDRPLPKKITQITNITDEMLLSQPSITTVLQNFVKFIKSDVDPNKVTYMIGHNINSFDIPFVKAQCAKYNIKFPRVHTIDTMRMSQYILVDQYSHSLAALCDLFGVSNSNAHRAMSDVNATRVIFDNLCLLFKQKHKKCDVNFLNYTTSF